MYTMTNSCHYNQATRQNKRKLKPQKKSLAQKDKGLYRQNLE